MCVTLRQTYAPSVLFVVWCADLMLPGVKVKGEPHPKMFGDLQKGDLCLVRLTGNRYSMVTFCSKTWVTLSTYVIATYNIVTMIKYKSVKKKPSINYKKKCTVATSWCQVNIPELSVLSGKTWPPHCWDSLLLHIICSTIATHCCQISCVAVTVSSFISYVVQLLHIVARSPVLLGQSVPSYFVVQLLHLVSRSPVLLGQSVPLYFVVQLLHLVARSPVLLGQSVPSYFVVQLLHLIARSPVLFWQCVPSYCVVQLLHLILFSTITRHCCHISCIAGTVCIFICIVQFLPLYDRSPVLLEQSVSFAVIFARYPVLLEQSVTLYLLLFILPDTLYCWNSLYLLLFFLPNLLYC